MGGIEQQQWGQQWTIWSESDANHQVEQHFIDGDEAPREPTPVVPAQEAEERVAEERARLDLATKGLGEIAGVPGEKPPAGWRLAEKARSTLAAINQGGTDD